MQGECGDANALPSTVTPRLPPHRPLGNHPCVLGWSLCNEGGCSVWGSAAELSAATATAAIFKAAMMRADPSRPFTAAVRQDGTPATDNPWLIGVVPLLDVMGIVS